MKCYFTNHSDSTVCVLSVLKETKSGVLDNCYIIRALIQLWYIHAYKQETLGKEKNSK